jgi:hypothetical protein
LEYPYSEDWNKGYLVINPEGRRTVILFNTHADRSSTQYARYLLAVKEGRYLTTDEEADHRDDDKTNDDLRNLRIVTPEQNKLKRDNLLMNNNPIWDVTCPGCDNIFSYSGAWE